MYKPQRPSGMRRLSLVAPAPPPSARVFRDILENRPQFQKREQLVAPTPIATGWFEHLLPRLDLSMSSVEDAGAWSSLDPGWRLGVLGDSSHPEIGK